jgi:transketolase
MRNALSKGLTAKASDPSFLFLTGDLGFQALESLRDTLGTRFINAGIAEQNMVSVAAGLAYGGYRPWVYSIAPFVYARPFEQIRNDVCMHKLPVTLVGNGGGYAYGVMGSTHHALEDYGALLSFSGLCAFVPAFSADVESIIECIGDRTGPNYLRLGRCEKPAYYTPPAYAGWRCLVAGGGGPTVVAVGPIAGGLIEPFSALTYEQRPRFWVVSELPIRPEQIPHEFLQDIHKSGSLIVFEEHVAHGGAGQMLSHALASMGRPVENFVHRHALGYVSGLYGSQAFHRRESRLDAESLVSDVTSLAAAKLASRRRAA